MIISIHQPNYFPWLGYFYKIYQSELFVLLDDVQYNNEGMQNYHYIKTPQGKHRLKIPVKYSFGDSINIVKIRYDLNWVTKHLKTIEMSYKKSAYFPQIFEDYAILISKEFDSISDLNHSIIDWIITKFGFNTKIIKSSDLNIHSTKEERVIDICKQLHANIYYSGTGAKAYQNEQNFVNNGIELRYSTFKQIDYPQLWGAFQSDVSILDYLMNCGYDWQRVLKGIN